MNTNKIKAHLFLFVLLSFYRDSNIIRFSKFIRIYGISKIREGGPIWKKCCCS